jgi:hypothetical protein
LPMANNTGTLLSEIQHYFINPQFLKTAIWKQPTNPQHPQPQQAKMGRYLSTFGLI